MSGVAVEPIEGNRRGTVNGSQQGFEGCGAWYNSRTTEKAVVSGDARRRCYNGN